MLGPRIVGETIALQPQQVEDLDLPRRPLSDLLDVGYATSTSAAASCMVVASSV